MAKFKSFKELLFLKKGMKNQGKNKNTTDSKAAFVNRSFKQIDDKEGDFCVYSTSIHLDDFDNRLSKKVVKKEAIQFNETKKDKKAASKQLKNEKKKKKKRESDIKRFLEKQSEKLEVNSEGKLRLNKVLRELNIGFDRACEYLMSEYGIKVTSINSQITEEQYIHLKKTFKRDEMLYNVSQKKQILRIAEKDDIIIEAAKLTDEEEQLLKKEERVIDKDKKLIEKLAGKRKRVSVKGLKPSDSWLTNYKYPYIRFISVPFGGGRKR